MLEKHALVFVEATLGLHAGISLCGQIQNDATPAQKTFTARTVEIGLRRLRQASILSDMQDLLPELDRLEQQLVFFESSTAHTPATLRQGIVNLVSRIQDVLKNEYYFHVDQRDVQFYLASQPFGAAVSEAFDKANEDIGEAAKCVALQRPTACVFHLMRVLELGVQALGKHLKVKINVQDETWHQIMLHVNNAIIALPSKTGAHKKKKSRLAEVAAHLQSVRLAWRNEVMHPKQTYTRDEALIIFNNCAAFMQHLAEVI